MAGKANDVKSNECNIGNRAPVILHLSDLHFGYDEGLQGYARRKIVLDELIKVVSTQPDGWHPSIICITGDVAMRATVSDYEEAQKWLVRLMEATEIGCENVVICPGNHDVDRKVADGYAPPLDSKVADRLLSYDHFTKHREPFKKFVSFCKKAGIPHFAIGGKNSYLTGVRTVNGIRFVCCNSAWFSQRNVTIDNEHIDNGKLWLGLGLLEFLESGQSFPCIDTQSSSPITVVLFHHPFEILHYDERNKRNNRRSTKEFLAYRSHIILTGHEHGGISDPDKPHGRPFHFRAGATYDKPDYRNNFRLIKIEENYLRDRAFESDPTSATNLWSMTEESRPKLFWNVSEQITKTHFEQEHRGNIERINHLISNIRSSIEDANYENATKQSDDLGVLLDKSEMRLSQNEIQHFLLDYVELLTKLSNYVPEDEKSKLIERAKYFFRQATNV